MTLRPGYVGIRQIWKFAVQPSHEPIRLTMPQHGAKPIALAVQGGELQMWVEVSPDNAPGPVDVRVIGTGWDYDAGVWEHVATALTPGGFVWHLLRERPR